MKKKLITALPQNPGTWHSGGNGSSSDVGRGTWSECQWSSLSILADSEYCTAFQSNKKGDFETSQTNFRNCRKLLVMISKPPWSFLMTDTSLSTCGTLGAEKTTRQYSIIAWILCPPHRFSSRIFQRTLHIFAYATLRKIRPFAPAATLEGITVASQASAWPLFSQVLLIGPNRLAGRSATQRKQATR